MNLSRSAVKLLGAEAGRAVISFLFIVLFARYLTAADLGTYFLFEASVALLVLPTDPGISKALKKRLSEGKPMEVVVPSACAMALVALAIALVGLGIAREPLREYLGASIVGWVAVGLIARVGTRIVLAGIEGQLRVGEVPVVMFAGTVLWTAGGAVLLFLDWGITGVIVARVAGDVLIVAWGLAKLLPAATVVGSFRVSLSTVRSLFAFAKYVSVTSIGGITYGWMDVAILGLFVAQSAIGAYEIAWRVTMLPFMVGATVSRTLFPQISSWDAADARERIESILPNALIPTAAVTIPAFVGTLFVGEPILRYLFGTEYTVAAVAMIVLMAEKILQSVHILFGRSLQAIDRAGAAAKATVVAVVVNVALNLALIPAIGLTGAAVATAVSFGVNTLLHARYLGQSLTIHVPWRSIGWIAVSAVVMGGALEWGLGHRPVVGTVSLFATIAGAIACYLAVLLVNPAMRRMVREQYRAIQT